MPTTIALPCLRLLALALCCSLATTSAAAAVVVDERVPESEVVRGDAGSRLDEYLTRLTALGFSGGIIAARDGEVLLCKGYGAAERASGRPFTLDTIFPNGSITKPFTGIAAVQLMTAGELSADELLSDHFDDVPEDKQLITVHQLLTHSAGLPAALGFDFDLIDRRDFVRESLACELARIIREGVNWDEKSAPRFARILVVEAEFTRNESALHVRVYATVCRFR